MRKKIINIFLCISVLTFLLNNSNAYCKQNNEIQKVNEIESEECKVSLIKIIVREIQVSNWIDEKKEFRDFIVKNNIKTYEDLFKNINKILSFIVTDIIRDIESLFNKIRKIENKNE